MRACWRAGRLLRRPAAALPARCSSADTSLAAKAAELRRSGFVVLRGLLSSGEASALREELQALIGHADTRAVYTDGRLQNASAALVTGRDAAAAPAAAAAERKYTRKPST